MEEPIEISWRSYGNFMQKVANIDPNHKCMSRLSVHYIDLAILLRTSD